MPKKRQPQSLWTKVPSTAPAALSTARVGTSQDGERASNVNDLLTHLRISQRSHVRALVSFSESHKARGGIDLVVTLMWRALRSNESLSPDIYADRTRTGIRRITAIHNG